MRVTSELWVSALTRSVFSAGGFATVLQRGSPEAGAIFIVMRDRLGRITLYVPASQTSYAEARPAERWFSLAVEDGEEADISARIERERRFDPDVWVVELETAGEPAESYFPVTTP